MGLRIESRHHGSVFAFMMLHIVTLWLYAAVSLIFQGMIFILYFQFIINESLSLFFFVLVDWYTPLTFCSGSISRYQKIPFNSFKLMIMNWTKVHCSSTYCSAVKRHRKSRQSFMIIDKVSYILQWWMIGVIWSMNLTLKLQTYKGIRTTVDFRRTIINGIKLNRSYLAVKESPLYSCKTTLHVADFFPSNEGNTKKAPRYLLLIEKRHSKAL